MTTQTPSLPASSLTPSKDNSIDALRALIDHGLNASSSVEWGKGARKWLDSRPDQIKAVAALVAEQKKNIAQTTNREKDPRREMHIIVDVDGTVTAAKRDRNGKLLRTDNQFDLYLQSEGIDEKRLNGLVSEACEKGQDRRAAHSYAFTKMNQEAKAAGKEMPFTSEKMAKVLEKTPYAEGALEFPKRMHELGKQLGIRIHVDLCSANFTPIIENSPLAKEVKKYGGTAQFSDIDFSKTAETGEVSFKNFIHTEEKGPAVEAVRRGAVPEVQGRKDMAPLLKPVTQHGIPVPEENIVTIGDGETDGRMMQHGFSIAVLPDPDSSKQKYLPHLLANGSVKAVAMPGYQPDSDIYTMVEKKAREVAARAQALDQETKLPEIGTPAPFPMANVEKVLKASAQPKNTASR